MMSERFDLPVIPKYLLRLNSPIRIRWDLWVMVLASWNCFAVPLEIAFKPDFTTTTVYLLFNFFIDFNFLIDIILNFRTTLIKAGDEIFDTKLIAKDYMIGRFWIDFVAIFPFDTFSDFAPGLELL